MKYNDNGTIKDIVIKSGDTLPVGTIVEYDGDIIPSGWEKVEKNINVLWINPDPLSEFANQTINLSSGDYDYLITCWYTGGNNFDSVIMPKGRSTIMQTMVGLEDNTEINVRSRNMTYISDTSYSIDDGYEKMITATSRTINNARMVPYVFIGLKID